MGAGGSNWHRRHQSLLPHRAAAHFCLLVVFVSWYISRTCTTFVASLLHPDDSKHWACAHMHFKLSYICISTCICVFAWMCVQRDALACCAAQLLGSAGKHLAAQAGAPLIKLPVLISLYLCASFCICICICASSIKLPVLY